MCALIPTVEVTDDTHGRGSRRPNGKADPIDTFLPATVCSEVVVDPPVLALVEKITILLAERRQWFRRVGQRLLLFSNERMEVGAVRENQGPERSHGSIRRV